MIPIFTRLTAKPGKRNELIAALEELATSTRAEPGNREFVAYPARDDTDVVLGYELFDDQAAVDAHRATQAVADARARLDELLAQPPEITYGIG